MDFHHPGGTCRNGAIRIHWRRNRYSAMELAAATDLWLEADYFLAGTGDVGFLPDPFRWIRISRWPSRELSATHGGSNGRSHGRPRGRALGTHDGRRA